MKKLLALPIINISQKITYLMFGVLIAQSHAILPTAWYLLQYGNFCGTGENDKPNDSKGNPKKPIDTLDKICQEHDQCYQQKKYKGMSYLINFGLGRVVPCECQKELENNLRTKNPKKEKNSQLNFDASLLAAKEYLQETACTYKDKKGNVQNCYWPVLGRSTKDYFCQSEWNK